MASPGVGNIGMASGQEVELRYWAGISGIYDTNFQPLVTDSKGNLIHVPDLLGTAINAGAYGSHGWRHSKLALSYNGDYRYYTNVSGYNGTNQALTLGYTAQATSRIVFDARLSGYSLLYSGGFVPNAVAEQGQGSSVAVFDTRNEAVTGSASATYLQSSRTSYTIGGSASDFIYQSNILTDYTTYAGNASFLHRVSLSNSLGAAYTYVYESATNGSFNLTGNTFAGQYAANLGKYWTLNITAGATITQIHQTTTLVLNPILGALLGTPSLILAYNSSAVYPSGRAELRREFSYGVVFANFTQAVGGGNGIAMGTRTQYARGGVSYTGIRKWNFGADGNYSALLGIGLGEGNTKVYGGGTGFTYEMFRYVHLMARVDLLHYDNSGYVGRRTTERAVVGLSFTPKEIPLSLW